MLLSLITVFWYINGRDHEHTKIGYAHNHAHICTKRIQYPHEHSRIYTKIQYPHENAQGHITAFWYIYNRAHEIPK